MKTGGTIYIHAIRAALVPQLTWAIETRVRAVTEFCWVPQPAMEGSLAGTVDWEGESGDIAVLGSALRELPGIYFEISEGGNEKNLPGWIMYTPTLGIFYCDTDTAGNFMVSEDRIRSAYEKAASDPQLLLQQFSLALGEPWNEELEALRPAHLPENVTPLHRSS